jgi:hypothetical protein
MLTVLSVLQEIVLLGKQLQFRYHAGSHLLNGLGIVEPVNQVQLK